MQSWRYADFAPRMQSTEAYVNVPVNGKTID